MPKKIIDREMKGAIWKTSDEKDVANGITKKGDATINGITYNVYVRELKDRVGVKFETLKFSLPKDVEPEKN